MFERPEPTLAVLAGAAVAILIAIGNLYIQMGRVRSDLAGLHDSIAREVTRLKEISSQVASRRAPGGEPNRHVIETIKSELTAELTTTKRQAAAAAQHAKVEAVDHADKLSERDGEERRSQHKEVIGELGQIKDAEASASARINDVSADLASIKNEVASTRNELQQTISELKRVDGDLGVQSGYIATNARELAALRELGERNYFDFQIERSGKPRRVGDISLVLKKTDAKHNKFTLEVMAGDKRIEKKDKTVNEPLQFYVAKSRMPSEIVVNEVQKDYIIGYLSTPKQLVARGD